MTTSGESFYEDFTTPRGPRRAEEPTREPRMGPQNRPPGYEDAEERRERLLRREQGGEPMSPVVEPPSMVEAHGYFLLRGPELKLDKVPGRPTEYEGWRTCLRVKLLNLVAFDSELIEQYHEELDTLTFSELKDPPTHPTPKRVDSKLYGACMKACAKGKPISTHQKKNKNQCSWGAGRQAVKVLDASFEYEASKLARRGGREFDLRKCTDMADLESYAVDIRDAMDKMASTKRQKHA